MSIVIENKKIVISDDDDDGDDNKHINKIEKDLMDMDMDNNYNKNELEILLEDVFNMKKSDENIEKKLISIFENHKFLSLKKNQLPDFEKYHLYFKHQPNGSQQSPDYHVFIKGYDIISIECKSSKSKRPMWNGGLPSLENDYIYIFHEKEDLMYIFLSKHIISEEDEKELRDFDKMLQEESKKFNESKKRSFTYYVRSMYNQTFNFDKSMRNLYYNETIQSIRRKIKT